MKSHSRHRTSACAPKLRCPEAMPSALKLHPKGPLGLAQRAGCWLHPLPAFSLARTLQAFLPRCGGASLLTKEKFEIPFLGKMGREAAGFWPRGQHPGWNSVWLLLGKLCSGRRQTRPVPCGFPSSFIVASPRNLGASTGIYRNVTSLWHLRGPLSGSGKNSFV